MHYFQDGEFKESKDLVESFPDGAIARYGAYQTILSPDLNSPAVFDIQTPDARRIRGGVRAIQLTDLATGNSVVLATIKADVRGKLLPPNQVIYRSAFNGLDADILYIWRHNAFSQNVIIKENLAEFPAGLDRATTRLEVVTELIEAPEVEITGQTLKQPGKPDLVDDGLINFGQMLAVPGMAFPVAGGNSLNITGPSAADGKAVIVLKQWSELGDGRKFVIESVAWEEIEPVLKDLRARADNVPKEKLKAAQARIWPDRVATVTKAAPMQVASLPYTPIGYLVDLELLPNVSVSSKTFYSTTTYYIPTSYQVTASVTFQCGTVIKYGPGGVLTLSGSFTSPSTGMATMTSRDDDTVGENVTNAGSPPYTSDGVVSTGDWAYLPLSLYYTTNGATVQRFRVRYAGRGVSDYSPYVTHTVQYCRLSAVLPSGKLRFRSLCLPHHRQHDEQRGLQRGHERVRQHWRLNLREWDH